MKPEDIIEIPENIWGMINLISQPLFQVRQFDILESNLKTQIDEWLVNMAQFCKNPGLKTHQECQVLIDGMLIFFQLGELHSDEINNLINPLIVKMVNILQTLELCEDLGSLMKQIDVCPFTNARLNPKLVEDPMFGHCRHCLGL